MENLRIPKPQDQMFGYPKIPSKFKEFRPHQWKAINDIIKAFTESEAKIVFLDAPTGSGKTLIAEAVRRLLKGKALYVCTTKTLQDQFLNDFPYAKLLKGRSNYPTLDYPERFYLDPTDPNRLTAADCEKKKVRITCEEAGCDDPSCDGEHYKTVCPWCHDVRQCPYHVAKIDALSADLAVMNTAYCLCEMNGPGGFDGRHLMIIDEADELESLIMNYVEIKISARTRKRLGIGMPAKKTIKEAWETWAKNEALPAIEIALAEARKKINKENPSVQAIRWKKHLEELRDALKGCDLANGNWVYTGYKDDIENAPVIFKPVKINEQASELLWKHAKKFLLMSATIIDPEGMAEDLGIPENTWEVVRVENTFPAKNRPIYVIPRANMVHKDKENTYPAIKNAVEKIIDAYDDRILVHTVSYDLAQYLYKNLKQKDRLLTYRSAEERDKVLNIYKATPGAVILAPSLDRGVDLKDDLCRVVIVAKIPFPNLGDNQIAARLYSKGGQRWYRTQTIRTLIQMTGRGMRSVNDYCDIYILDKQFIQNIWAKSQTLLPKWWRDAIVRSGNPKIRI